MRISIASLTFATSLACLASCKPGLENDVSKRKLTEQTVTINGIQDKSVRVKLNVPEGFIPAKGSGFTFTSEQGVMGPTISVALRLESTSPKNGADAMKFHNLNEAAYATRDLPDGFVVTNTPKEGDSNYYTIAVRHPAGLPTLSATSKFVLQCEVNYLGARALKNEKGIVKWMESTCADVTIVP